MGEDLPDNEISDTGERFPTADEKAAIQSLKRLARRWPKSLWLYSASGTLWVMQCEPDGSRKMKGESFDQSACLDFIAIPNEGGDW